MVYQTSDTNLVMEKIISFCVYQERSIGEVEEKLKQWAVQASSISRIINLLQKEDYLNEERFVKSFSRGKFRMKKWGRYRIESELRMRGIPELLIQEGLAEIDPAEYYETLKNLMIIKKKEFTVYKSDVNRQKIINFAFGKGFESDLIFQAMNELKL